MPSLMDSALPGGFTLEQAVSPDFLGLSAGPPAWASLNRWNHHRLSEAQAGDLLDRRVSARSPHDGCGLARSPTAPEQLDAGALGLVEDVGLGEPHAHRVHARVLEAERDQ